MKRKFKVKPTERIWESDQNYILRNLIIFINLIVTPCIFVESLQFINQRMHIYFHIKHFKTLRHVSILSDQHQGALFLAKVILRYSQFNSYLQTRCCGRCASYDAHLATAPQHIPTQHDMLPQHLVCKYELNCEYRNITLARNKAP